MCFISQLRNAMVNRKTGTFSMEVKKTVDRGVRSLIKRFSVLQSDESETKGVNLNPSCSVVSEARPENAQ